MQPTRACSAVAAVVAGSAPADIGAFSVSSGSANIGKLALIHAGATHSGADSRSGIGAGPLGSSTVVAACTAVL